MSPRVSVNRRQFLRTGLAGAVGAATLQSLTSVARAQAADGPYGSLEGMEPDENGVILPPGFSSRIVAVAGESVGDTGYQWHAFPDGAATFEDGNDGWYYACNSEIHVAGAGGVSGIHFGANGEILDAYPVLEGSISNCAGGPTPWGSWLSCEEDFGAQGLVWECDPAGKNPSVPHPAMGLFKHEAVAVDPVGEQLYLTQDEPLGNLYRYTPHAYPDLSSGLLEVATVDPATAAVTWSEVPDPSGQSARTESQIAGATAFAGGEGIWYHNDFVYFTTKGDNRVHAINVRTQTYQQVYEPGDARTADGGPVLSGVDNITVDTGTGDLYVAEDGGNMELVLITPDGVVTPFLRVTGHPNSEIAGPVFNPRRDRLYFSSQRGPTPKALPEIAPKLTRNDHTGGVTFEITGPFRGIAAQPAPTAAPTSTPTTAPVAPTPTRSPVEQTEPTATPIPSPVTTLAAAADTEDGGGNSRALALGVGATAAAFATGALIAVRARRSGAPPESSS